MIDSVNWAKESLRLGNIAPILAIVAIGAALLFLRPRWGRRWIVAVGLAFWFVSTPLGSGLLVRPLTRNYHQLDSAAQAGFVEAIVVLGGGSGDVTAGSDVLTYPSNSTALRALEAARVFRLLDGRPLVVASGGRPHADQTMSEASIIAGELMRLGVPSDRIVLEGESITTHDQAIKVTRLMASKNIRRFVLVTSPPHMARSVRVFRAQHADVVPAVSALMSENIGRRRFFVPNDHSLAVSDQTLYEYAGFIYYWARGWFRPAATGGGT